MVKIYYYKIKYIKLIKEFCVSKFVTKKSYLLKRGMFNFILKEARFSELDFL